MSDGDDDDTTAALLAAGALTPAEHALARERMSRDPAFAAKAREWETALAPLAGIAPPVAPPDDLLARIERRIDAQRSEMASRTLRDGEGEWIDMAPGIRMKVLHRNLALRRQTIMLDAAPGAVYPPHEHPQDEECYMLSGDLVIGDEVLYAGDYQVALAGTRHPMLTTRAGCRCILILAM